MAKTNAVTIEGNLTADPELRFLPSGIAVAGGTVAHTPSRFNKTTNEWEDEETVFLRFTVWREHAENVAESLKRGDRVVVTGRLKANSYETRDGEKRTSIEIDAEHVTPSLQRASAKVVKADRAKGQQGGWDAAPTGPQAPADDPWATR